MTQKEFCLRIDMPLPSLRDYELGKTIPGGEALLAFTRTGINAHWLLTGEGAMFFKESEPENPEDYPVEYQKHMGGLPPLHSQPKQSPVDDSPIDYELLQSLIEMLERILSERRLSLEPARKAAAIQIMYEYCMLDESAATPATVEKFLKLVA
jgi:hypothetical protein